MNVLDELKTRGFIENTTHDKELEDYLNNGNATMYVGFDPTASSLHVGHLIPIMSLAHMQRHGHRPIALVGGGTARIGDPSGRSELRQMMTYETIEGNVAGIKKQLSHFLDFTGGKAILANNADWLAKLEYIPFLREIGRHFSVNRMIKFESYKQRLHSDEGLNFIEFNYMLLQSYDFLNLFDTYSCRLQMGGSDQWGNIVAGIELTRKMRQETVFGMTFPLITKSDGSKMGKTAKGAVWLDPEKTSPYEYFQFWVNTQDGDVAKFMKLFTFLPLDEIVTVETFQDADINLAKTILAYEATKLAHGEVEAKKALAAAASMFGSREIPATLLPASTIPRKALQTSTSVPSSSLDAAELAQGIPAFKLFVSTGLCTSGGEAKRLIKQGGASINDTKITQFDQMITAGNMDDGTLLLKAGKKRFHKITITQ
ncbi:MAG: tyrosine--tRNA ligase [Desulfoplanes sp.]|nr:tyrosine--tRNA ligase [Desulfoplanes sp.]MDD4649099.1 tyrosine--tRNA ligase [Desulfoplanes sp.]